MNVFISADIEGIDGVVANVHSSTEGADYKRACSWMTQEVNAAVEGAIQGGAQRVVVKDAHNTATNINLEELHPAAELISGWGPLGSMVEGIDSSFNALFLIGYHAHAVTVTGTLAHTWSSHILDVQINGQTVGETAWAAATAGHFGVPLTLVTGDDQLIGQVSKEVPGPVQTVITKYGLATNCARMRPIAQVREDIRLAAARAINNLADAPVFKPSLPATITLRFRHWENMNAPAALLNVTRMGPDTFQFQADDFIQAHKLFAALHRLARS